MSHAELKAVAEAALVTATGAASVVRQCPRCGSIDHGQPVLVGSDLRVSIAYAGDLAAIAWAAEPVGIDIERTISDAPRHIAAVGNGLSVEEWTRLEALGKAAGTGLADWPAITPAERLTFPLHLPDGYVGTIAGVPLGWRVIGPQPS